MNFKLKSNGTCHILVLQWHILLLGWRVKTKEEADASPYYYDIIRGAYSIRLPNRDPLCCYLTPHLICSPPLVLVPRPVNKRTSAENVLE
jgi:hypothetical protein